jgi:periplasmic protein TonB
MKQATGMKRKDLPPVHDEPLEESEGGGARRFIFPAVMVLVLAAVAWLIYSNLGGSSKKPARQTVKIAVLPDTPPPPPPPPKEEKKPEPEQKQDKPQQEQPKQVEAPVEPQQLKMEGPAGDGPSAFSSGSITSDYKGGDVGTGTGTGAVVNRMQFAFFSGQLQKHIQAALARNQNIKLGDYRLPVQVWLSPTGEFQRVELLGSSGDPKTDEALTQAFKQLPPVRDMPADLPQPIKLRITNRMTG